MALTMYVDESGDHNLTQIDPSYPLFVLCGVIIDDDHHATVATESLNSFKTELFGRKDIILHTADFTRNRNGFEKMINHEFRTSFFSYLEDWIRQTEFKIISCVIKKEVHLKRYGKRAIDPYILALSILVERFIFECGPAGGVIIAESRSGLLDNALELAFLDLKIRGTNYISPATVRKRIHSLSVRSKQENIQSVLDRRGFLFGDTHKIQSR